MFFKLPCHRFAMLSLLAAGGVLLLACRPESTTAAAPPPTVIFEATYPGANAQVVAEAVAAPIEQQINGVEQLRSMRSECRGDRSYLLTVVCADGVDRSLAQTLVQNRVNLTLSALPDVVKARGVSIKQG